MSEQQDAPGGSGVLGESGDEAGKGEVERNVNEGPSGDIMDKYLYAQRGFTSEIFKIEIQNIPKYIGYNVRNHQIHHVYMCCVCARVYVCVCVCVCVCVWVGVGVYRSSKRSWRNWVSNQ